MKDPAQLIRSANRLIPVFWMLLAAGALLVAVPLVWGIGMEDNAPGFVAIGAVLVLFGLVGLPILYRRRRILAAFVEGESVIDRYTTEKSGVVVFSEQGLFAEGELFTMTGLSCSIKTAALEEGFLRVTCLIPKKNGLAKRQLTVEVPRAHEPGAGRFVDAVSRR